MQEVPGISIKFSRAVNSGTTNRATAFMKSWCAGSEGQIQAGLRSVYLRSSFRQRYRDELGRICGLYLEQYAVLALGVGFR
jgi:hypothetical protein